MINSTVKAATNRQPEPGYATAGPNLLIQPHGFGHEGLRLNSLRRTTLHQSCTRAAPCRPETSGELATAAGAGRGGGAP
jgi:hypothetical protein